ncbi:TRAP transporter substrate-binding protein DctP [Candidatus Poribacteria bacterium]
MNRRLFSLIILIAIYLMVSGNATGQEVIKLGTMATRESDWGQVFSRMNAKLIEESQGQLRFQFYWGRSEQQLIESVESGLLDSVSLTGTGLGNILPEAFVFQLPMLFSEYKELDCVRDGLAQRFEEKFAGKGYILLGWGELGFIHLFSKKPIRTQSDLRDTQVWVWDIDPIGKEFIEASCGVYPVLLPITDVRQALQNDIIQTVYTSPLGCIAFGWHTELNYMSDFPDFRLAAGIGATIMNKDRYDGLSDNHSALLRQVTLEYHKQLIKTIREKNEESIDVLKEQGIEVIEINPTEQEQWKEVTLDIQNRFAGELFPEELLDKIRELLNLCNDQHNH